MPWNYISLSSAYHTIRRIVELTFEYNAISECLRQLVGRERSRRDSSTATRKKNRKGHKWKIGNRILPFSFFFFSFFRRAIFLFYGELDVTRKRTTNISSRPRNVLSLCPSGWTSRKFSRFIERERERERNKTHKYEFATDLCKTDPPATVQPGVERWKIFNNSSFNRGKYSISVSKMNEVRIMLYVCVSRRDFPVSNLSKEQIPIEVWYISLEKGKNSDVPLRGIVPLQLALSRIAELFCILRHVQHFRREFSFIGNRRKFKVKQLRF